MEAAELGTATEEVGCYHQRQQSPRQSSAPKSRMLLLGREDGAECMDQENPTEVGAPKHRQMFFSRSKLYAKYGSFD